MKTVVAPPPATESQTICLADFALYPTAEKANQLRRNVYAGLVRGEQMILEAVSIPGDDFDWEKLADAWYAAKALQAVLISLLESMVELSRFASAIEQQIDRARDFLDG